MHSFKSLQFPEVVREKFMNQATNTRSRRWVTALAVIVVVLAGLVVPQSPWNDALTPEAEAQTKNNWSSSANTFKQCSFRRGSGEASDYANQLCWLDMSGLIGTLGTTPRYVGKDLGRYELTFMVNLRGQTGDTTWATDNTKFSSHRDRIGQGIFGSNTNGTDYFTPYAGDTNAPSLSFAGRGILDYNQMAKFEFRNIQLRDKVTGQLVTDYHLNVIDAESTQSYSYGENMTYDAPASGQTLKLHKQFVPTGYNNACDPARYSRNVFGPGIEEYYNRGDLTMKDFYCRENTTNSGQAGTYLLGGDGVTALDVGLFTRNSNQAFALALNMGRMSGGVASPNTTMEKAATGQETSFDFSMSTRYNGVDTPVPWQGEGIFTQVLRRMDPADTTGTRAVDSMVFKSTASGAQKDLAFKRYDPVWQCTLSGSTTTTQTIRAGQVPAGYQLNNNPTTGVSELVFANPTSTPVQCKVTWEPKYKPASLTLRKAVSGTAETSSDIGSRLYDLGYECTAPTGFAEAYPTVKLADSQSHPSGAGYTVTGLPAGSQCTLREGGAAPGPGTNFELTWQGSGITQGTGAVPTAQLTLQEGSNGTVGTNDVVVANKYDYRTGTLVLDKRIIGEAVSDLGSPRDYSFELKCDGTNYAQTKTLSATGTDDELNGSLTFENVPVGRDCSLTPLSGLSAEEGKLIDFDGRTLSLDGAEVTPSSGGVYTVKVPDYAEGATPTTARVAIEARYSYEKRDVRVSKELQGPAANKVDSTTSFPVNYRCEVPGDASSLLEGQIAIPADGASTAIPDVRVGAECVIYEGAIPAQSDARVDRTTVSASDSSDTVTTLSNDQAKTTPVLTVNDSVDANQNRVRIMNHYINQLGTVSVSKLVTGGMAPSYLPADYQLSFQCGPRTVETAPNSYTSVNLKGSFTLSEGQTKDLVVDIADPALAALVNDQGGSMGVPYGNTCIFSESTPQVAEGVLWSSDVGSQQATVNSPAEQVTVTNNFSAAGEGVTVTQASSGNPSMQRDVTYDLSCQDSDGLPIDLGQYSTLTLGASNPSEQVPSTLVVEGSTCQLTETTPDPGTRDGYQIDRDSTLGIGDQLLNFNDEAPVDSGVFTVGAQTVVSVTHNYGYVNTTVNVTKDVNFDAATGDYISQVRKNVKYNRLFNMKLVCTPPGGGDPISEGGQVSSAQSNDPASQQLTFNNIPDGSSCTASEGDTTAAEGIDVKQEVTAGGQRAEKSVDFVINGDTPVTLINTYSRRLAKVDLSKVAKAPIDIEAAFPDTPKGDIYYTHNFTMVCTDPEGTATESGQLPAIPVQTITGPGSTQFAQVPVGAECTITGDQFGQLDLKKTAPDGTPLETHLRPQQVVWQLQRDDQSSQTDTDLADGATTSQSFTIKDDAADDTSNNVLTLTNYYDYVMSKVSMSKKIEASDADMQVLRAANPDFRFNYQCTGVGYSTSQVGLPETLSAGDTTLFPDPDRLYRSPESEIPSGAWCVFTEVNPNSTPDELTWSQQPREIAKRVGAEGEPIVSYDFVNTYERRTVPVRLASLQDGYLGGTDGTSYNYNVVCNDPMGSGATETFSIADTNTAASVADEAAPSTGRIVNLPVGYTCQLDLSGSTALNPRPQLEVTNGERTPFVQFAKWVDGVKDPTNPTVKPNDLSAADVTSAMKAYTYSFDVDPAYYSTDGEPVITIAGEAMHIRDKVDVTFQKESEGAAGEGATFNFSTTCGDAFSLQSGQAHVMNDIEVERDCSVNETFAAGEPRAIASVESAGELIGNPVASNQTNSETGVVESGTWKFTVLPVLAASDLSTDGAKWTLTAMNSFPGINLKKTIDGSPLSAVSGAVADTAVLTDDAQVMRFNYTVTNDGAMPANSFDLTEPELAGYTVRAADGSTYVVGSDGAVPTEVCNLNTGDLAPGDTRSCSFDVVIDASTDTTFTYRGTTTVTANASGMEVSDSDTYGAIRLTGFLAAMLPDTGMQTLVWVLVLGLLILGIGLWRYLRNKDDEEGEEAEEAEE